MVVEVWPEEQSMLIAGNRYIDFAVMASAMNQLKRKQVIGGQGDPEMPAINPYFNGSLLIEMNNGLNRVHNHIMLER